jgi:hypothetical protein
VRGQRCGREAQGPKPNRFGAHLCTCLRRLGTPVYVARVSPEFPGSDKCLVKAESSGSATREKMVVVAGVTKRPLSARDEVADSPFGISISLARDTRKGKPCCVWTLVKDKTREFPFAILPTKDLTSGRACLLKITLSAGGAPAGGFDSLGKERPDH